MIYKLLSALRDLLAVTMVDRLPRATEFSSAQLSLAQLSPAQVNAAQPRSALPRST